MKLSIAGPQGSGKTTQVKLLARFLKLPVVTTGEAMRQLAKEDTPQGRIVKSLLDQGLLAPDDIVADYVRNTVNTKEFKTGFVMDGYPRSLSQLKLFDPDLDRVFYLDINDGLAMQRLLKRGREDDTLPLIEERLRLYHELTQPLLQFYASRSILSQIDGGWSVKKVQDRIRQSLSGQITAHALKKVLENIKVGISARQLDKIAEEEIKKLGGELSFTTVKGYQFATCITFNEQVVHGIPTERIVKEGDLISIDLGAVFGGWHTDAAWTVLVGSRIEKFLKIGKEALWDGIAKAVEGNTVGDIGAAIAQKVQGAGYSIVRSLVGHGVGKSLHEEPEVPGYGQAGTGVPLKRGMSLAIEVIYTMGHGEVVLEADGWTVATADRSLAGLFEMTVVVGEKKAEVLTDWRKIP